MKKILAGLVLAGGSLFAGPRIAVGVGFGVPVAPAPVYVAPAPVYAAAPGPGYGWVDGYWYFSGGHRLWHAGYWAPGFRGHVVARGFRR
jgi:hypothetical protein